MKRIKQKPKALTLTLDGSEITAERFVKSVSAFAAIVREVSETLVGDKVSLKWIVSVEEGSTKVHFTPRFASAKTPPSVVSSTIKAVADGFHSLGRKGSKPSYWSDLTLKNAKEIASVFAPDGDALSLIKVSAGSRDALVTKKSVDHIDSLVSKELRSYGTVEGRLRTVTEHGGLRILVHNPLTAQSVSCFFEEVDKERFIAAFSKRVAVYGEIRYGQNGLPVSIKASDIRVFGESAKLPTVEQMIGIYS